VKSLLAIDRRKLIIEAATKSFSLFGYKATTMDQIAKLANVGKGTIYTFFKNKEDLFYEIITSLLKEMKEAAEQFMHSDLPFHEKVDRTLYKLLEFRKEHQLYIKLFQEESDIGTPEVQEVMLRIEESILNYIKNIILEAIQNGEIKECEPEITAFVILKLYISLIFDWEKHHEPLKKEEISKLFKLYLFQGLST